MQYTEKYYVCQGNFTYIVLFLKNLLYLFCLAEFLIIVLLSATSISLPLSVVVNSCDASSFSTLSNFAMRPVSATQAGSISNNSHGWLVNSASGRKAENR